MTPALNLKSENHLQRNDLRQEVCDGFVILRQSGGRPLRIRGELIADCTSWMPLAPAWQELKIYSCMNGQVALALRTCRGEKRDGDVFRAQIFLSLEEALLWLQEFNPATDLFADLDASDRRATATDIALRAAALRQRADWVELLYSSMIGELLYRLDINE
jgi:hypothetical protein